MLAFRSIKSNQYFSQIAGSAYEYISRIFCINIHMCVDIDIYIFIILKWNCYFILFDEKHKMRLRIYVYYTIYINIIPYIYKYIYICTYVSFNDPNACPVRNKLTNTRFTHTLRSYLRVNKTYIYTYILAWLQNAHILTQKCLHAFHFYKSCSYAVSHHK